MCCGILGQGVQKALSLDLSPYEGEKPHLVVVRFILKRGQTNVEIEIREFEGGVRATGLLCLLGVGVGLCTFLAYKLCSQLHLKYFASSSVDKNSLKLSCVPGLNAQVLDSGISLGIKKIKKPGVLHRSQLFECQQFPQVWRRRIIDWLARSTFPLEQAESSNDENDEPVDDEDDRATHRLRRVKKFDPMMTSMQSGWSSGFVSNPDNAELSCNDNSLLHEGSKDRQSCENEDELMDGIEEESEGLGSFDADRSQLGRNDGLASVRDRSRKNANESVRPNSGRSLSSTSSDIRAGHCQAMRRNCYSFASHKSGDSSLYDYRESLVSKGFSVDLGENLEAAMLSNSHEFATSDHLSIGEQDHGAVDHMDWLQYELTKIQMDIDCLNQKFDDLCQPKADEPASEHQNLEDFLTEKSRNARPRSASVESSDSIHSPHEGTPDIETFDFIWDYHSDLGAVEQPSFISARPGGNSFEGRTTMEDVGKFGMSCDVIDEEEYNDDFDLLTEENGDASEGAALKTRRESIVLFYFDDDIDDNIMGELERSRSISNISTTNHPSCNNLLLSNKSSSSKELQRPSLLNSLEKDTFKRLFKPGSPRNLKRSKAEQSNNKKICQIERIFSCEDRRIVGDEKKLFEHLECDLHVDVTQISSIRKGYSKIFDMWGTRNVRSFRSERFSILGPITFQVLLHGFPILSDIGGNFQNAVQYLVAAIDNGHHYLMEWKYKGFLWAPKNEVLFKLINSLRIFCEQVGALRKMAKKCREQYLATLLNHTTDMEVHLVEALKIVTMLKVISSSKVVHKQTTLEERFGPSYATPELIFKNLINVIEDGTIFEDIQLSLFSTILSINIEVLSPSRWGSEGFTRSYPVTTVRDSNRWDKISLIEDDPAFLYCLPALHNDE